ncbi:MAG: hypothetical protein RL699_1806 [Bacteroidota bacterium]|jgi:hypothetical protein
MTPLFDKDTNLVGWLSDDKKNIFDTNINWVAFISNDNSVWTVKNKVWVGNLYGNNVRDISGKTSFWNTETQIENSLRPMRPLNPLTPLTPLRPLRPLNPLRPLRPLTPLGGWSVISWEQFVNGI